MTQENFAEFNESITLEIPKIDDKLLEFVENDLETHGLIVEVAAIHEGMTSNFNFYSAAELEKALGSWVAPYPKPIIMNHDLSTDPIGRVMAAKMDKESDGTQYTRLQIAVTDPSAIQKIADKRYLTGSVGGRSEEARCSVCGKDWALADAFSGLPCRHVRGKSYKGVVAFLDRKDLSFKEYSIVNSPADSRSIVRDDAVTEPPSEADGWVRVFNLSMDKEQVMELAESDNHDILSNLKKKEASPLYLSLKGAFLSALAVHESEGYDLNKENLDVEIEKDEQEDVLAITEELSEDLAAKDEEVKEEASEEVADETKEEGESDAEQLSTDGDDASENDSPEASDTEEKGAEEGDQESQPEEVDEAAKSGRPEAQEKGHTADVDSQFNKPNEESPKPNPAKGADRTREEDESAVENSDAAEDEAPAETTETELEETSTEDFEPRVKEMEAEIESLKEENARLKKALHRTLAERVVDAKIAMGLESVESRDELLADHSERSASSLADSLRDLSKMPAQPRTQVETPEMEQRSAAVEDPLESSDESDDDSVVSDAEDVLVDTLMGRRKL